MKLNDINKKIYDLQEQIEDFMRDLSGQHYECTIAIEGDTTSIKIESDLDFIELVMDEFENFYVDLQTNTFRYEDEVLEFLEELDF
jgi:pyruvate formate-lyase activating enzyme-like uncharacterized protein